MPNYQTAYEYYSIFKPIDGKKLGKLIKSFSSKSIHEFTSFIHYRYYPEARFTNGKLESYHRNDIRCLETMKSELLKGLKKRSPIKTKAIHELTENLIKVLEKLNNDNT
jgi:hypothetical protein